MGAEVDALLRLPRLRARPRVLRATSGELTLLERLDDALPALWLYGAGHVGQALTRILTDLPLRLTWIDSRAELFPASVASGVRLRCDADSLATVAEAPAEAHFLVMTHSHALDYELVRAILRRNDFASLGLIGSQSKAARFRSRLSRDGIARDRIARLVCPIGVPGIESKWPAAIAVGVAAQVMQNISGATLEARYDGHRARDSGAPLSAGLGLARVSRAGLPRESGAGLPRARGVALPLVPEGQLAAGGHANSPLSAELTLDLPTVPPSAECAEGSCSTCGTHRQR
jgi:xanthine dehydrogenase accessory protein XdhC